MKTYVGVEVSGQLHSPVALPPNETAPEYTLDRSLGGPQSRSGRCEEEKNPLPTSEVDFINHFSFCQSITKLLRIENSPGVTTRRQSKERWS
jgi:hypothetical protein